MSRTLIEQIAYGSTLDMVEGIKKYALDQYTNGWDIVVECYDDSEILEIIDRHNGSMKGALDEIQEMVDIHNEQASNCRFGDEF